jgi:growth hormone-inducible transmembrane protein
MSFTLTLRASAPRFAAQMSKPSVLRAFHHSAPKQFFTPRTLPRTTKPTIPLRTAPQTTTRNVSYQAYPVSQPSRLRKLLVGGAIFGGTLVAINLVFNRETRDDGGMPMYEREYLNSTFLHMGLGLGTIAFSARAFLRNGVTYRIMMASPWVVAIGGLAAGIGTMVLTRSIDPDK